jgi:hypothetical protein
MATLPRDQLVKARCPVCSSARVGDLLFFTQRLDPPRDCQIIHTTFNPPIPRVLTILSISSVTE